jgi:hypothetical protein
MRARRIRLPKIFILTSSRVDGVIGILYVEWNNNLQDHGGTSEAASVDNEPQ